MQLLWKVIPEFENYEVSNTGLVRASDGTILKQQMYDNYLSVRLYKEGTGVWKRVNRLVAEAYVPNLKQLPIVNHLDYNTFNNHSYNLAWVTQSDNVLHSKDRMNFNRYKVQQLDTSLNVVATYNSCVEAVLAMGGKNNGSAVARAIKQGTKSYGYYWKRATTS